MVMIFIPCPQPVDEIHTLPSSMVRLTINFIMPQVKASQWPQLLLQSEWVKPINGWSIYRAREEGLVGLELVGNGSHEHIKAGWISG